MKKLLVSGGAGIILGIIGGPVYILIPWGIVGLAIGWWCVSSKQAWQNGAVYGFFMVFAFMLAGYNGTASVVSRLPFFAALAIFGALCGIVLTFVGMYIRKYIK